MKLYHTSNPYYRDVISREGLIPKQETWGKAFSSDMNKELRDTKAIFLKEGKPYDNGYDDDIYEVDISKLTNDFTEDSYINDSVYTTKPIPLKAMKLIYKGTGNSKD
jgi:hypothetical protein